MVSRKSLYDEYRRIFEEKGIDDFDLTCIFQDMLGERFPLMDSGKAVPEELEAKIRSLAESRAEGYPLQYLLGEWEFYGYPFKVREGVLIPRPDTETLIEDVLRICRENGMKSPRIADLCSGSGCIAITLKKQLPDADVCAVELSDTALECMRENVALNGTDIHIIKGDVMISSAVEAVGEREIIVSNPPYLTAKDMSELMTEVRYEPETALFGGDDGLDFYRVMTPLWRDSLSDGGWLVYEFGLGQHDDVKRILEENSFENISLSRDAAGIIRTASAQKIGGKKNG